MRFCGILLGFSHGWLDVGYFFLIQDFRRYGETRGMCKLGPVDGMVVRRLGSFPWPGKALSLVMG